MKKIMFVNNGNRTNDLYLQETLDMIFIAAAFDAEISVVFLNDGILQLAKNQDPKSHTAAYKALIQYDIQQVYAEKTSLITRNLTLADLFIPASVLTTKLLAQLMTTQDIIIDY